MKKIISLALAAIMLFALTGAFCVSADDITPSEEEIAEAREIMLSSDKIIPGEICVMFEKGLGSDEVAAVLTRAAEAIYPGSDPSKCFEIREIMGNSCRYQLFKVEEKDAPLAYATLKKSEHVLVVEFNFISEPDDITPSEEEIAEAREIMLSFTGIIPGEIIVTFEKGLGNDEMAAVLTRAAEAIYPDSDPSKCFEIREIRGNSCRFQLFKVEEKDAPLAYATLKKCEHVLAVEYNFIAVLPEDPPVYILGDVSGDRKVSAIDYMIVKRAVIGTASLGDSLRKACADVDENGKVGAVDYAIIRRYVIGTYRGDAPIGEALE